MKTYLGLFLIAVMVVSVLSATGVVTTKRVIAADPASYVIDVNAPTGTTYRWTSADMNFHYQTTPPKQKSLVLISQSKGSAASAFLRSPPGVLGHDQAGVGVALQPNVVVGSAEWTAAKDREVVVTVTTRTEIAIKGDRHVAAEAGVGTFGVWPLSYTSEHEFVLIYRDTGSDSQGVKDTRTYSATETTTVSVSHSESPTGTPLTLKNVYTGICATVFVETGGPSGPTIREYASGKVIVESIELTFV
jgi:hypothetical protein